MKPAICNSCELCYLLKFFLSSPEDMLIDYEKRERDGESERTIYVREKHLSVASRTHPRQGPNLQPRHMP